MRTHIFKHLPMHYLKYRHSFPELNRVFGSEIDGFIAKRNEELHSKDLVTCSLQCSQKPFADDIIYNTTVTQSYSSIRSGRHSRFSEQHRFSPLLPDIANVDHGLNDTEPNDTKEEVKESYQDENTYTIYQLLQSRYGSSCAMTQLKLYKESPNQKIFNPKRRNDDHKNELQEADNNDDNCHQCEEEGFVICCGTCTNSFCSDCYKKRHGVNLQMNSIPQQYQCSCCKKLFNSEFLKNYPFDLGLSNAHIANQDVKKGRKRCTICKKSFTTPWQSRSCYNRKCFDHDYGIIQLNQCPDHLLPIDKGRYYLCYLCIWVGKLRLLQFPSGNGYVKSMLSNDKTSLNSGRWYCTEIFKINHNIQFYVTFDNKQTGKQYYDVLALDQPIQKSECFVVDIIYQFLCQYPSMIERRSFIQCNGTLEYNQHDNALISKDIMDMRVDFQMKKIHTESYLKVFHLESSFVYKILDENEQQFYRNIFFDNLYNDKQDCAQKHSDPTKYWTPEKLNCIIRYYKLTYKLVPMLCYLKKVQNIKSNKTDFTLCKNDDLTLFQSPYIDATKILLKLLVITGNKLSVMFPNTEGFLKDMELCVSRLQMQELMAYHWDKNAKHSDTSNMCKYNKNNMKIVKQGEDIWYRFWYRNIVVILKLEVNGIPNLNLRGFDYPTIVPTKFCMDDRNKGKCDADAELNNMHFTQYRGSTTVMIDEGGFLRSHRLHDVKAGRWNFLKILRFGDPEIYENAAVYDAESNSWD
eukprot:477263_1